MQSATTDAETIKSWWAAAPRANVGLRCGPESGVIVVDIDPRNGGEATILAHRVQGRTFPHCPKVKTANGGLHLYFRWQDGIPNSGKKIGAGVDLKAQGGYVVAPPSIVGPSSSGPGGPYTWLVTPAQVPPPRLPIWLTTLVKPALRAPLDFSQPAKSGAIGAWLRGQRNGNRNNALYWASHKMREEIERGHRQRGGAVGELLSAAMAIDLPLKEAQATIESAMKESRDARKR